jgi:hypothetical protein
MGRKILAVITGLITAVAVIMIGEMMMSMWGFIAPGKNPVATSDEAQHFATIPTSGYVFLALIYAVASFAGGFVVWKMSRRWSSGPTLALVVAGVLFLSGILNFFVLVPYHPLWVSLLCLAIYFPFTLLGYKIAGGGRYEDTSAATY